MKFKVLVLLLLLKSTAGFGQTIKGVVVDSKTQEPLSYSCVSSQTKLYGTVTDSSGKFQLTIHPGDSLLITSLGYFDHLIICLDTNLSKIDLGTIHLVASGVAGYMIMSEKRRFSKRERYVCRYVNNLKTITSDDLVIKCPNDSIQLQWKRIEERTLQVNFEDMRACF